MGVRGPRRIDFTALVDRLLSPEVRASDASAIGRLRLTILWLLMSIALAPLMIVDCLLGGRWIGALVVGVIVLGLVGILVLVCRRGWTPVAGHAVGVCLSLYVLGYALEGGDVHGAPVIAIVGIPAVVSFLIGSRVGWAW